ncbi:hypothetical protein HNQ07_004785 [Deinococcus metalli]|uniref:Uncharacterized protein n=1 Tax=Deinococcus metalli TaxID=1141878 RepID=A0A7W8KJE1_9DEIO|nr:hypothetical protein [Deinococcus metalli]
MGHNLVQPAVLQRFPAREGQAPAPKLCELGNELHCPAKWQGKGMVGRGKR